MCGVESAYLEGMESMMKDCIMGIVGFLDLDPQ